MRADHHHRDEAVMFHVAKKGKLLAFKRKLQREFISQVRAEGLSNAEAIERASIFPPDARGKLKVVKWPKF